MPSATESQIRTTVEAIAAEHDLFVEDVRLRRRGGETSVEVTLDLPDGPGNLDLDRLGDVSRAISAAMDEIDDAIDGTYVLEIGTPGAERVLTTPRLFRRAEGRLAALELRDNGSVTARVVSADDDAVTVIPEGSSEPVRLPYDDIAHAQVTLELR